MDSRFRESSRDVRAVGCVLDKDLYELLIVTFFTVCHRFGEIISDLNHMSIPLNPLLLITNTKKKRIVVVYLSKSLQLLSKDTTPVLECRENFIEVSHVVYCLK